MKLQNSTQNVEKKKKKKKNVAKILPEGQLVPSKKVCFDESLFKIMRSPFYFILNNLFVLKFLF